jgi:hypothetical protein
MFMLSAWFLLMIKDIFLSCNQEFRNLWEIFKTMGITETNCVFI